MAGHGEASLGGPARDPGEGRLKWRRLLAEAVGTFFLGLAWALRGRPSLAADVAAQGDGESDSSAGAGGV